jgi:hypothetical protein
MNRLMLLAAGAAALSLAACDRTETRTETKTDTDKGEALRTISRLDCPEKEGDLQLVTAATDGRTCAYQAEGAEVTLRLIDLENGDASATLNKIEAELQGVIPPPKKGAGATADADNSGKGGSTEINFPGLHIKADDSGANVQIGAIKVDADDEGANVRVGETTTVNANDDGAEIRTGKSGAAGVRGTYILASDKAPGGYHVVGYEARGPSAGPIVVAVVKAKERSRDQHDIFDDMKDLVKRNVGG